MAKRLLLTLLALLGLAAQVAPAHAGACSRTASALVIAAEDSGVAAVRSGVATVPVVPAKWRNSALVPALAAPAPVGAPVLIGIDRARE